MANEARPAALEYEDEEVAAAEAARTQPPRRKWPWIVGAVLAAFIVFVVWKAVTGTRTTVQPRAAQVVVQSPPRLASAPIPAPTEPTPMPSTPAPGRPRIRELTREPTTLASTSRAQEIRKAEQEERKQREERREAGQSAGGREADRPGVMKANAWVNPHPEFTIPSHTLISCSPDAPINSDTPGPIGCIIDRPIRSEDGTNVLLWPGAFIEGSVGQGMQRGNRRLMLSMERIRATDFARIPMRGIGASALGENGITGVYDDHLWERIQAGVLLTVIEGLVDAGVGAASSALQEGGGNQFLNFGSVSGRARGTLGSSALQQDYNRPSTIRRDQADSITVRTIGDIDLSKLYELRETINPVLAAAGQPPLQRRNTR